MASGLKQVLSITLPISIVLLVLAIFGGWPDFIGATLLGLVLLQGIFWKFVRWSF